MSSNSNISTLSSVDYRPPSWLRNGHLATIYPALFRKIRLPRSYNRERISTEDDDFLDLDWLKQGCRRLVIISHGLEGSSNRPYVQGMAHAFSTFDFDVLAWNYRGCSEEMNRSLTMYHSGATSDLHLVIEHSIAQGYEEIYLVGFSLGGNLTLKYLGERQPPEEVIKSVVYSVPLDLSAGSDHISQRGNWMYEQRFLKSLRRKLRVKKEQFPELDISRLEDVDTLRMFDDLFTAPIHGFEGAEDYYQRCSSKYFIKAITVPTLVVNALNDPFLPHQSLDPSLFEGSSSVMFERPQHGGHCGFASYDNRPWYWSEQRAVAYCLLDQ